MMKTKWCSVVCIWIRLSGKQKAIFLISLEKWNESGFRPLLCRYRLNRARITSWRWWDEWDHTALQTQDSKFKLWRSEAEQATSRSQRLSTIPSFTSGWWRNIFVSSKPPRPEERTPNFILFCYNGLLFRFNGKLFIYNGQLFRYNSLLFLYMV